MRQPDSLDFESLFCADSHGIIKMPMLIKGQLMLPESPSINKLKALTEKFAADSPTPISDYHFKYNTSHVIRQAVIDRTSLQPTGDYQFLVFDAPDPRSFIETDTAELARSLYALPFDEVLNYVQALQETLSHHAQMLNRAAAQTNATQSLDHRLIDLLFAQIPALFDPQALGESVDRELSSFDVLGRNYLDNWIETDVSPARGMMARFADHIFATRLVPVGNERKPGFGQCPLGNYTSPLETHRSSRFYHYCALWLPREHQSSRSLTSPQLLAAYLHLQCELSMRIILLPGIHP